MAARILTLTNRSLNKIASIPYPVASCHCDSAADPNPHRALIGRREIVGFGYNGNTFYADRTDYPMPAIRWREPTPEMCALREKEKGDWKQLSIEEKKTLYRYSFRQTYAEIKAPPGEWKHTLGIALILCASALWFQMALKFFVYEPLPESYSEEWQKAQLRRIFDIRMNPVEGISSRWDYKNNDWKQ